MQTANMCDLDDRAAGRRLGSPLNRSIRVQREMSAPLVIIGAILMHQPLQSPRSEHDDMIETLASYGSDKPFDVRVYRLRRVRPGVERAIAVPHPKSRRPLPRERLTQLLNRPRGRRMVRDGYVDDAAAFMGQDDQHKSQTARRGRDYEKIRRHDLSDVIRQKCAPRL